jgi:hypothetical protein
MSSTTNAALVAMAGPWPLAVNGSLTAHVGGGQAGAGPTLRGQALSVPCYIPLSDSLTKGLFQCMIMTAEIISGARFSCTRFPERWCWGRS